MVQALFIAVKTENTVLLKQTDKKENVKMNNPQKELEERQTAALFLIRPLNPLVK